MCHWCTGISLGRLVFQASLGIQAISRSVWGCCPLIKCSWQCLSRSEDRADTSNALACAGAGGSVCGGKYWSTHLNSAVHEKFNFFNFSNFRGIWGMLEVTLRRMFWSFCPCVFFWLFCVTVHVFIFSSLWLRKSFLYVYAYCRQYLI